MNDELKEQLSALVDDELRRDEAAFLCRRLAHDDAATEQLGRYFLISDTLRRQLPETVDRQLAGRIAAALELEPALQGIQGDFAKRLIRPLAGLGVAASVAMVAVTMWSSETPNTAPAAGEQRFVTASAATPAPVVQQVMLSPDQKNQWERLDPEVQQRLNAYLINHSEHSSTGQFGGVLNYVRITGQQERE